MYEPSRQNPIYQFAWGIRFYFAGLRMLFRHPWLLGISLIPIAATVLLLVGFAIFLAWGIGETLAIFFNEPLRRLTQAAIFILALAAGYFLYLPLARILLAPFSEALSRKAYALHTGDKTRQPAGGWGHAVKEGVKLVAFQLLLIVAGIGLSAAFPPAAVPTGLLLASFLGALDFLDIPLSVRGWPLRQKLGLMARSKALTLGFGAAAYLALFLPGINLFLLPAGVIGATILTKEIVEGRD